MGPLVAMDISTSGLTAYREMMNVIASNIANMYSTVTPQGGAYQAQQAVLSPGPSFQTTLQQAFSPQGVEVAAIVPQGSAAPPAAAGSGLQQQTNVDLVQQMSQLIAASRAYDANASAFSVEKSVETRALQLGQNA
ncbi:MAG: flagellar basal body protein [Thermaerobacter sp.]|nr:flagellar basal body protein [Thermaerobacter sp.]